MCFSRDDAELASIDMNVTCLVADSFDCGTCRSDVKIGMGDENVLSHIEPNRDSCLIAILEIEIDIVYRTVEGKLAGVSDRLCGWWSLLQRLATPGFEK